MTNMKKSIEHRITSQNSEPPASRDHLTSLLKQWRQRLTYLSVFAAIPAVLTSQPSDALADDVTATETKDGRRLLGMPDARDGGFNKPSWLRRRNSYRPNGQGREVDLVSSFTGTDDCPGRTIPAGSYTPTAPYLDSGDTTGANNTVTRAHWIHYIYYWYDSQGPDHIYTFAVTNRGVNSRLAVTTTSPTYKPMIYVTEGTSYTGCEAGPGQHSYTMHEVQDSRWGGTDFYVWLQSVPLNKQLYLFVDSRLNDAIGAGPYTIRLQDVTVTETPRPRKRYDFDSDNRADLAVFRPSEGIWYMNRSAQGFAAAQFGLAADKLAPADYDGDGKTDIGVFRDGTWYWINSSNGQVGIVQFGSPTDVPVPADYTGDGRDEIAIFRDGQWWMLDLSNGHISVVQFGLPGDKPVVADYDGDGRKDQAVYRNGQWHLNRSSRGYSTVNWGLATDKPVIADFNGDDRSDPAIYRDGTWYILLSYFGYDEYSWHTVQQWGLPTDIPVPADYDGDGGAELAVYRNGVWYTRYLWGGFETVRQFGLAGDRPVPAAYVP